MLKEHLKEFITHLKIFFDIEINNQMNKNSLIPLSIYKENISLQIVSHNK